MRKRDKLVVVGTRLLPRERDQLRALAELSETTASDMARRLIRAALARAAARTTSAPDSAGAE